MFDARNNISSRSGLRTAQRSSRLHAYTGLLATAIAAAMTLTACGPGDALATATPAVPVMQPVPAASTTVANQPAAHQQDQRVAQRDEPAPRRATGANYGQVRSIEPIRTRPQGSGTGAVVGGVLGAVLGNQIGSGNGRAAATVLGGVGGAVAGNNVERNHNEGVSGYRVRVELDNGDTRSYTTSHPDELRIGDRVRVDNGRVRRV